MTTFDKEYSRRLRSSAAKTGDELAELVEMLNKYAYVRNLGPSGAIKVSEEGKCLSYGRCRLVWRWIEYTARVRCTRAGRAALAADKVAAHRFIADIREGRPGFAATAGTFKRDDDAFHGF
jgi:hypothetical protein